MPSYAEVDCSARCPLKVHGHEMHLTIICTEPPFSTNDSGQYVTQVESDGKTALQATGY